MIESGKMKLPPQAYFVSVLLYYGAVVMAPHKLIVTAFSVVYVLFLWRKLGDFKQALMAMYLVLIPIQVGKKIPIELISVQELDIPGRAFGVGADITILLSDIVVLCMAIVLVVYGARKQLNQTYNGWIPGLLFLYPILTITATLLGSFRPEISLFHALFTVRPFILYYFFSSFRVLPFTYALSVIGAGVMLEAVVVGGQILRQGPLGLVIEAIPDHLAVDFSREAAGLLRYGGTYMHANALAHALFPLLLVLLPSLYHRYTEGKIHIGSMLVGMVTLVLTMSRSAFVGFGAGFAFFLLVIRRYWKMKMRFVYRFDLIGRLVIAGTVGIISIVVALRLLNTVYSGGLYGSLETRKLLLREYGETLRAHPVLGVGLEMDVYSQYLKSMVSRSREIDAANRSVILYFPEPVHNGFLRLLVQTGIVGTLPYMTVYIMMGMLAWRVALRSKDVGMRFLGVSLVGAYIASATNSMMQPILPDLPLLTALTMLYLRQKI